MTPFDAAVFLPLRFVLFVVASATFVGLLLRLAADGDFLSLSSFFFGSFLLSFLPLSALGGRGFPFRNQILLDKTVFPIVIQWLVRSARISFVFSFAVCLVLDVYPLNYTLFTRRRYSSSTGAAQGARNCGVERGAS